MFVSLSLFSLLLITVDIAFVSALVLVRGISVVVVRIRVPVIFFLLFFC